MEKYLFYLNLDSELPDFYYFMAEKFSHERISLIPIKPEQLAIFISQQEMTYVICPTLKIEHIKIFQAKLHRLLKNGINNNTLTVYHLSSFAAMSMVKTSMITKNYFCMSTPVNTEKLVRYLSKHYHTNKDRKLVWPGGKRATLPAGAAGF